MLENFWATSKEIKKIPLENSEAFLEEVKIRKELEELNKEVKKPSKENIPTSFLEKSSSENAIQIEKKELIEDTRKLCKKSYQNLPKKYKIKKRIIKRQIETETVDQNLFKKIKKYIDPNIMDIEDFFTREATVQQYQDQIKHTPFFEEYKKITMEMMIQSDIKKLGNDVDHVVKIVEQNNNLSGYAKWSTIYEPLKYPEEKKLSFDEEFELYRPYLKNNSRYREIIRDKDRIKMLKEKQNMNKEETTSKENKDIQKINSKTENQQKEEETPELTQEEKKAEAEKDKQLIKEYDQLLDNCKFNIKKDIQKVANETILATHISWLLSYFDISTLEGRDGREYGKEMIISSDTWYQVDYKNGIHTLIMTTNIGNSIPIKIYYKLNTTESQVSINDVVSLNENDIFSLNTTLASAAINTPIPMLQDSYKKVQELILEIYEDLIKNGKNIEDIENTLKEKISVLLFKDFNNENKVKNEIQKKIEKNLTMRMLQDTFFPPNIQEHIKLQSNIQKNDTNIWTLLNMRNTSIEQLDTFYVRDSRRIMKRLEKAIQENHPSLGGWRNALFKNMKKETGKDNNYTPERWISLNKFFWLMMDKNNVISFYDIEALLDTIERGENVEANIQYFSDFFQEKYQNIERETEQ